MPENMMITVGSAAPALDFSATIAANNLQNTRIAEIFFVCSCFLVLGLAVACSITTVSWSAIIATLSVALVGFIAHAYLMPDEEKPFNDRGISPPPSPTNHSADLETHIESPLDQIHQIFGEKSDAFLHHYPSLKQAINDLGEARFDPTLVKAVRTLDAHHNSLTFTGFFSSLLVAPPSLAPVFAEDRAMATSEEVEMAARGLPNPYCSCFMNAALQAMFHHDEIKAFVMQALSIIAEDRTEVFKDQNPCLLKQPIRSIEGITASQLNALIQVASSAERFKALDPIIPSEGTAPDATLAYSLTEVCKLSPGSELLSRLYTTISLKQAASYALALLKKWQDDKEILSDTEAKILRLSLIKLINREARLTVRQDGDSISVSYLIPGLDGEDMLISPYKQEEVSEFAGPLFESLSELTRPLAPTLKDPLHGSIARKVEIFNLPSTETGSATSDSSSLKVVSSTDHDSDFTGVSIVKTIPSEDIPNDVKYDLTRLDLLTALKNTTKECVQFKTGELPRGVAFMLPSVAASPASSPVATATEPVAAVAAGPLIDPASFYKETIKYDVTLPESLMLAVGATFYDRTTHNMTKAGKTELVFTNEEDFSITIPSSEVVKESKTYQLVAFSVHSGPSPRLGHYYTCTKHTRANGQTYWIEQNDTITRPCNKHKIRALLKGTLVNQSANMLIFKEVKAESVSA